MSEHRQQHDSEDEEEREDLTIFEKLKHGIDTDMVLQYHPETKKHSYNEVRAMTTVVRDKKGRIIDPLHRTIPILTKYEKARVLGVRAKQIDMGAQPLIAVPPNVIRGYDIAVMELEQKRIPFIIRRPLPNGSCEYWKVEDLEYIA